MSKNHPHDNIYSILGKLDALKPTPEEKHQSLIKEIRESVEAQGSITEGVSAVQAKLAKSFAESDFSKMSKAIQKTGKSKASADAITAAAGREKLGQKEMTRRSVAGRKDEATETCSECGMNEGECEHTMEGDKQFSSDRIALFGKVNKVIQGIQTPEQYKNALGFVKRAFQKLNDQPGGPEFSNKTIQRIHQDARALNADLAAKAKELGIAPEKFLEGELTRKHGVTKHIKTDYPGYPSDDLEKDSDGDTGSKTLGGRGRPRKASTVNPRVDPNAPKKGRGRPSKVKAPGASTFADPFGRVTGIAPNGKKGTVHSMDESFAHMENRFLMEMNFRKMEEETGRSMDELMSELQQDINHYKSTGHCSDKLKDFLSIHSHSKKQMADEAAMEAAAQQPAPAPANPHPVGSSLQADQIPGKADLLKGKGRDYYEEESDPLEGELNELAKLAGLKVADEGNAFTGKLKSTPKGGNFELGGKGYTDTSTLDEEPNEGNAFTGKLAQAKAQHKGSFELGGKEIEVQEADIAVDAEPEEHANSPKEKYMSMKASTMNPGEADNGEKAMHPDRPTFKNGDNALAKPATSKATTLEAKLAAEYESIKKSI